jgi:hypothetical protein
VAVQIRRAVAGVGRVDLDRRCEVLDIADRDQRMVIYTAVPGSSSAEALRLLAVVGADWSTVEAPPPVR